VTPCSTIDYPGELAAVVYCRGCPWRCSYCHNKHLRAPAGEGDIPWDDILAFVRRRRGLLDAVVFSGGEPTMQPELAEVVRSVKALGFKVGLHTAGAFPERLSDVLPHLDWVGMDIKAPFEEYEAVTAIPGSGGAARKSADLVRKNGVCHQFRTTLDPFLLGKGRIDRLRRMVEAEWGTEIVLQPMTGWIAPRGPIGKEPR